MLDSEAGGCLCALSVIEVGSSGQLVRVLQIRIKDSVVWGGRREEGLGWGTHVYLWRIHFDIWQN